MDYKKTYNSFIDSRRKKENLFTKDDYTEIHHIIPRCMGGSNESSNLIKLTPEDHFFAHLLLAKAYGGKNWLALSSMINRGTKTEEISYKEYRRERKRFDISRKFIAKQLSGLNNTNADRKIYTIRNAESGEELTGYRCDLYEKTGLDSSQFSALINGRKRSFKKWYYPANNPDGIVGAKARALVIKENSQIINLYHYDGRSWAGKPQDFQEEFGTILNFRLDNPNSKCHGWFRTKEAAENFMERKKVAVLSRRLLKVQVNEKELFFTENEIMKNFGLSRNDLRLLKSGIVDEIKGVSILEFKETSYNKFYKFLHIKNNKEFVGTIKQASVFFNIKESNLRSLVKGKRKKCVTKGVTLIKETKNEL